MATEVDKKEDGGWRFALRALSSRNYRLFFSGQSVSLIGTWLTRIATSWLVWRLTKNAFLLGIVGFAGQIPTFIFAPYAGVMVDRWDRHRVLVVTQILSMLQSFGLAILALMGVITVAEVVALQIFQGLINAFDTPARQAFVIEMVENREDLSNAIALNSSMVNGARLLGPTVAGVLIAAFGEGWCFLIDGFSYIAVIISLVMMTVPVRARVAKQARVMHDMMEGFRYAFGFAPMRNILLLVAFVGLMGMPYTVLMPVIATKVMHGGAHTLGFLMAAAGVGALIGAVYLASRRTVVGLGRVIPMAAATFGVGLMAFSRSTTVWVAFPLLIVAGMGFMVEMAASNTILQTIVDERMRGRVMSFYTMSFFGTAPFGSLLSGAMAGRIGAQNAILVGGASCIVAAGVFALQLPQLRRLIRPIYQQLGILPEIATGLEAAAAITTPPDT